VAVGVLVCDERAPEPVWQRFDGDLPVLAGEVSAAHRDDLTGEYTGDYTGEEGGDGTEDEALDGEGAVEGHDEVDAGVRGIWRVRLRQLVELGDVCFVFS
jgi:hypothetical protein